jgi:FMN phosphatase YigB (HAD superfamily)
VRVLPIPFDLSVERGDVTGFDCGAIDAVTFDFGNTLVAVSRAGLRAVVERTADGVVASDPRIDRDAFLQTWAEERDRQFREEVPQFREVDLDQRLVRVFARLRGMAAPPAEEHWDQGLAARFSEPSVVARAIERYSGAFVEVLPPMPGAGAILHEMAAERRVAILSNWPLAATVDRYAEANGWTHDLTAIVVSQRVGTIKPHRAMFEAARTALGSPPSDRILHVGDDWAADVVGALDAGWRAAWIRTRPVDSPLPRSERDADHVPDLELDDLGELPAHVGSKRTPPRRAPAVGGAG